MFRWYKWTFVRQSDRKTHFLVRCKCGVEKEVNKYTLFDGLSKGCENCYHESHAGILSSQHRAYGIWEIMKQRCYNPNNKAYRYYGERGIKMSERWRYFENFWSDMGATYYDGATIDRINENGDYERKNCRWIDRDENARKTRRTKFYEHDGRRLTIPQWAKEIGVSTACLYSRIQKGMTIKEALEYKFRTRSSRQRFTTRPDSSSYLLEDGEEKPT